MPLGTFMPMGEDNGTSGILDKMAASQEEGSWCSTATGVAESVPLA